ncbi:MAG TPA: hypothetical protein VGL11_18585 [Candidatus Binatia bacterium]|jgi:hypothetical protein
MLKKDIALLVFAALLSACMPGQIPKEALQLSAETPARRQLENRRFETKEEQKLLDAAAAVLKELGFTVDAKDMALGVIAASKRGSAYNVAEIATTAAVAVITYALSFPTVMPFSRDQSIRVSIVTRPEESDNATAVRLTFQRVVWDNEGKVAKSELLTDPLLYRAFFEKLSKSAAVEAREL